jgi:hypothetical protein
MYGADSIGTLMDRDPNDSAGSWNINKLDTILQVGNHQETASFFLKTR